MRKLSLIKGFLVVLLGVMVMGCGSVFAASSSESENIETVIFGDNDVNSTPSTNTTVGNGNSTNNTNNSVNNTNVTNNNTNKTNNTNNTNASVYNNTNNATNLPKTGVEDSIPTMVLIVVFGISAIYAYKKISDYKNI